MAHRPQERYNGTECSEGLVGSKQEGVMDLWFLEVCMSFYLHANFSPTENQCVCSASFPWALRARSCLYIFPWTLLTTLTLPSPHNLAFPGVGTPPEPSSPIFLHLPPGDKCRASQLALGTESVSQTLAQTFCTLFQWLSKPALVLILGSPLGTPPSVPRSPSHPLHPPSHCKVGTPWDMPQVCPRFPFLLSGGGDRRLRGQEKPAPLLLYIPLIPL